MRCDTPHCDRRAILYCYKVLHYCFEVLHLAFELAMGTTKRGLKMFCLVLRFVKCNLAARSRLNVRGVRDYNILFMVYTQFSAWKKLSFLYMIFKNLLDFN